MGLLTNNGPPDWHPASKEIKKICSDVAQYCKVIITNFDQIKLVNNYKYIFMNKKILLILSLIRIMM